jgi:SpoVK/Ycf46/Vps4 family AAA+-type ATPase
MVRFSFDFLSVGRASIVSIVLVDVMTQLTLLERAKQREENAINFLMNYQLKEKELLHNRRRKIIAFCASPGCGMWDKLLDKKVESLDLID